MKPKFLDCAPETLIKTLNSLPDAALLLNSNVIDKSVNYMLEHSTNIESCTEEQIQKLRAKCHNSFQLFPLKDQTRILEKLLTDFDAGIIWRSLSRKIESEDEYEKFWYACMAAIAGSAKINNRTKAQHKKHFIKIKETAAELSRLLLETDELVYYPITKLISDNRIEQLHTNLKAEKSEQHTRSYLGETIPDIQAILSNIALKAEEISEENLLVKKPNSEKAATHYFIRHLSGYLREKYNQPLHEIVASTSRVVFNDPMIDANYVRKLIKN